MAWNIQIETQDGIEFIRARFGNSVRPNQTTDFLEDGGGLFSDGFEIETVPNLFGTGSFVDSMRTPSFETQITIVLTELLYDDLLTRYRILRKSMLDREKLKIVVVADGSNTPGSSISPGSGYTIRDIYIKSIDDIEMLGYTNQALRLTLTLFSPSGKRTYLDVSGS